MITDPCGYITLVCVFLQISLWDSFMWWWGTEEVGAIRKRKKPMGSKVIMKPKPKE